MSDIDLIPQAPDASLSDEQGFLCHKCNQFFAYTAARDIKGGESVTFNLPHLCAICVKKFGWIQNLLREWWG